MGAGIETNDSHLEAFRSSAVRVMNLRSIAAE